MRETYCFRATLQVRDDAGGITEWSQEAVQQSVALSSASEFGDGSFFDTRTKGVPNSGIPNDVIQELARLAELCAEEKNDVGVVQRWGAEERSPSVLARLLNGAHILDMPNVRRVLSSQFCTFLAGKSSFELKELLGVEDDGSSSPSESIFELPGESHAASGTLAELFENDYVIEEALSEADVPTLNELKNVDESWRHIARNVLCARLYKKKIPQSHDEVTDIDVELFLKADGPGVTHLAEAIGKFHNLARMHAHGFVVDVTAVRALGPARVYDSQSIRVDLLRPVRDCINGDGEPPSGLLLAVRAARYGETEVVEEAFAHNEHLTSIVVPAGLTIISFNAFQRCSALQHVELPTGLKTIVQTAFFGCGSLQTVTLPRSLESIGNNAFSNCTELSDIELPTGLKYIGEGAFRSCSNLKRIIIPAGITEIKNDTFRQCIKLGEVKLPDTLKMIRERAFVGCTSLAKVTVSPETNLLRFAFPVHTTIQRLQ